jgi:hypothetical protein
MEISFLIGSGFSVVDKYPSRSDLNIRLKSIDQSEISIAPDGSSFFLNGRPDPNGDLLLEEKYFVQRLLEYYTSTIIPNIDNFDYEYFFDFYQGFINGKYKCWRFDDFIEKFKNEFKVSDDAINLLDKFNNTFNQLISDLLYRIPSGAYFKKPYPRYNNFLVFIEEIRGLYEKVHLHTLNHDLLLEELANSDAFEGEVSDGFEDKDSSYYSIDAEGKEVRLKRFSNNFTGKFSLLKLHGSLDNYIFSYYDTMKEEVKIPAGVSIDGLYKETKDKAGNVKREKCFWNYYPDFLSGTLNKTTYYSDSCYYGPLFDRFISNLNKSHVLISIGYGFKDYKINEILEKNFIADKTKKMIVISPSKPECKILENLNVIYFGEHMGVHNFSISKLLEFLN